MTISADQSAASLNDIKAWYQSLGLSPSLWSNGPGDRYAPHAHDYVKYLACVRGSISFELADGQRIELRPGSRLRLPARTVHGALVGPDGVTCLEAPAYDEDA